MVLYLVGAGLGDIDDFSLKGLRALEGSAKIYLEAYTSIQENLTVDSLQQRFPGKPIQAADRDFVESGCEKMLEEALTADVSFIVVGDPFGATTHADLVLRAKAKSVTVRVVHNASILTAVGCSGLQLYRFGQTVSIPFFDGEWRPRSFVDKILENMRLNLHTLCLLDIKVKEQSVANMIKRNKIYEPPRFMTVNVAIAQLLEVLPADALLTSESQACGLARVGTDSQCIRFGSLDSLLTTDFGRELHSLIICAPELHEVEAEFAALSHACAN